MPKCNIITYRLKRGVQPTAVLAAVHELLDKHSLSHTRCLWSLSNISPSRGNNSILKIKRDYPQLAAHLQRINDDTYRLANFQQPGYQSTATNRENLIREIVCQIPKTYHIDDLEYILDGIPFSDHLPLRDNPNGPPIGSYIAYNRQACGDERHSYITLGAEYSGDKQPERFRAFFFDLVERLPGQYEGTQIIFP